jgi:amino acid adenylation domain-containing protein
MKDATVSNPSPGSGPMPAAGTVLPRWSALEEDSAGRLLVDVSPDIGAAARSLGVSQDAVMLAAFVRVVASLTGESDICVGYGSTAVPAVPLRVRLGGGSWRDLVLDVHRLAAEARDVSARLAAGSPDAPAQPFDTVFGSPDGVTLSVARDGKDFALHHRRRAVDDEHAARVGGYLTEAVSAICRAPDEQHATADLLSEVERRLQIDGLNGPARTLPGVPFHQVFAERAAEHPDRIAAVCRDESWTYADLDRAAEQVCRALITDGVTPGEVVAIVTARHLRWMALVIGVLRAGGVFLPLDPDWPGARVALVLGQSGCRIAVADDIVPPSLRGIRDVKVRTVGELFDARPQGTDATPDIDLRQPAYIYFTSGSTGLPKGAVCEHLGLLNHLYAKIYDLRMGPGDVVAQTAESTFDISLWQLIAPLLVGARTVIVPTDDVLDIPRFLDILDARAVTVAQLVPSYLDVLLEHLDRDSRTLDSLREVSVTGEAVSVQAVERWFAAQPRTRLVNAYGATEVSDDTTHEVMTAPPRDGIVPVGRPIHNVAVSVLGADDRPVPLGAPGEIAFSGNCVGRGYINDPERTAEAFGDDPWRPGLPMYRTGDFGRWLPGGKLGFGGRRDEQLKVSGIRIELGDVESRMREHPQVRGAAVVALRRAATGAVLVGFYTSEVTLDPEVLAKHLAGLLPAGVVPVGLIPLASLPHTANGKVDKKALLAMADSTTRLAAAADPPRTEAERTIARAWSLVLGLPVEQIGRGDDFFALGGGSLAALRVAVALDGFIRIEDLLNHPVLADVAATAQGLSAGTETR